MTLPFASPQGATQAFFLSILLALRLSLSASDTDALRVAVVPAQDPDRIPEILLDGATSPSFSLSPTSVQRSSGVDFLWSATSRTLKVRAADRGATVTVKGADGWSLTLPQGVESEVGANVATGIVDARVSGPKNLPAEISLADGAKVSVANGSWTRYDWYSDKSYVVSGTGSVTAITAEGQAWPITAAAPPLTGGPLAPKASPDGASRLQRLTPTVEARLSGAIGGSVELLLAGKTTTLQAGKSEKVVLPNGSSFVFALEARSLSIRVEKGDLQAGIEGIASWKARLLTGESAAFTWDTNAQLADVRNLSSTPIRIALHQPYSVSVAAGAAFQFARMGTADFAASAHGGAVVLYNASNRSEHRLDQGNLTLRAGAIARAGQPVSGESGSREPVTVTWSRETVVQVAALGTTVELNLGGERSLTRAGGGELKASLSQERSVLLGAAAGNYTVLPGPLNSWSLDLPQENSVSLNYNEREGLFVIQAPANNPGQVVVVTPERVAQAVEPGSRLVLVLGRTGVTSALAEGNLVFFEPAGASGPSGATAPPAQPLVPSTGPLDVSRIIQPAGTVVGF